MAYFPSQGGSGAQTGAGSPLGSVTPAGAGALYADTATGNVWVALSTSSSSWVESSSPPVTAVVSSANF